MRRVLILGFLALLVSGACAQNRFADVRGRVVDRDGTPVTSAKIEVFPMEVAVSGMLPSAITDENGVYRFTSFAYGRTRLCAVKQSAGYPNTQLLLFVSGQEEMPIIDLKPGAHINVDIKLGPPNGVLDLTVVDGATGVPVKSSRITFNRDEPKAVHSLTGISNLTLSLPPVPIDVEVVAPGYKPWRYSDPKTGTDKLILMQSEHRSITVELAPLNSN